MDPDRWNHIKDLFQSALELPETSRTEYLDAECADDVELRAEVESLLASHLEASSFIEQPALGAAVQMFRDPIDPFIGALLGPYRITSLIGHGGMGAVYEGTRADDHFSKRVAVKLIRRGLDTQDIVRRFRTERQILARLDHPNICKLLDGGVTADGLPYFVMDRIDGEPIDRYAQVHTLSIPDRLKLFRQVCSAVQYAHQNLIVHRDIKPGNILVTAEGEPKLLDFGIAKLLEPVEGGGTVFETETAERLLTPEYASPEQVRGEPVTTVSDVYSLGVVLYQLLSGQRPYQVKGRRPQEILKAVCEQDPERPSDAVITRGKELITASVRGRATAKIGASTQDAEGSLEQGAADKLRRTLSGDLDTIILKAMRKEPKHRYASADQLSEDIRRYLEGLPVLARRDTFGYRASKFIKRHQTSALAAALIALSLIAGIVGTAWQAHVARREKARADARFNDVRRLADSFMFEFHDAIKDLPGTTSARELVVRRAWEYLNQLSEQSGNDEGLQRELATAYLKLGDIQGRPGYANLGDRSGAEQSYQRAIGLREQLALKNAGDRSLQQELEVSHERLGDIFRVTGKTAASLDQYRRAQVIGNALLAADPDNASYKLDLARVVGRVGDSLALSGNTQEALQNQNQSMRLVEELVAASSDDPLIQRTLFITRIKIGDMQAASHDMAGALASYQKAFPVIKALADSDLKNVRYQRELAACLDKLGNAFSASKDLTSALSDYRQAMAIRQQLADADKQNAEALRDMTISYDKIGTTLAASGDTRAALDFYHKALLNDQAVHQADPGDKQAYHDLSISQVEYADMLLKSGNRPAALDNYRLAIKAREELASGDPTNAVIRNDLAEAYSKIGDAYFGEGSVPARHEALGWYQKAFDTWTDMKNKGMLAEADAGVIDDVRTKIARCAPRV